MIRSFYFRKLIEFKLSVKPKARLIDNLFRFWYSRLSKKKNQSPLKLFRASIKKISDFSRLWAGLLHDAGITKLVEKRKTKTVFGVFRYNQKRLF